MSTFGKQLGGGRRKASRESVPLPVIVSTVQSNASAEVMDISTTGVRLQGDRLPPRGTYVSLKLDCVTAFGTIMWCRRDYCGVAFDVPLASFELQLLRREVPHASIYWQTDDERLAARDWQYGFVC